MQPTFRSRRLLPLIAPLVLALAVALLGGISALRKIETFQPLGFSAQREAGGWRVSPGAGPASGLEGGDVVLLINGHPFESAAAIQRELGAQPSSDLGVLREGALVTVRYQRPPLAIDLPYLLLAASGAIYLLIGLFTLIKSRQRQGFVFFLWCLSSAAIYLFTTGGRAFDGLDKALVLGEDLARLLLPPLTLHLFLVFPRPFERWRRWIPFLYLPSAVLAAIALDLALDGRHWLVSGSPVTTQLWLDRLGLYLIVVYVSTALVALVHRVRKTEEVEERRQLRWLVVGVAAGYLPFFVLYVVPLALALHPPALLTALAVLALGVVPLSFAYAILRYKLWDIELIVREAVAYTLTFLLGAIGFALLNLFISRGVPDQLAQTRTLLSFAAGLVIAGVMVPARRSIGSALTRLHYRGSYTKRSALVELGRELLHERDLDQLCAGLLDHLETSLELDRVNLYLSQDGALVAVRPQAELPAQASLSVLGEKEWATDVVAISGLDSLGATPQPMLELFQAGYRYAFPLTVRTNRVGILLTSYRLDQVPLNSEDVELARQVLNQASLAIENAQLLDQLHQKLNEVGELQRYSEGIIESSPAGLAVLSPDQRVVSANLAFAALVGLERRVVMGSRLADLLPAELPEATDGLVDAHYRDRNGKERFVQMSVAELGSEGSRQRILIVQDTTERVAIERELKEKDRLASLGMLAAGVAHEVNTPITGISSYAQMLLDETPEDDPRHTMLKKMERQTFRAARIVSSLLEFARDRRAEQLSVPLTGVVSSTLDELAERLAERRIVVSWAPPTEEVHVLGCETELVQVFVNLVTNAMDVMRTGGRLDLALATAGERVRVTVADTGPGIPQEQIEKIFQPFFSTKLSEGGTGLGLSISFEIVRRHGGEMRVASTAGQGSAFTVELPIDRPSLRAAS